MHDKQQGSLQMSRSALVKYKLKKRFGISEACKYKGKNYFRNASSEKTHLTILSLV
jgi:hypothetical protein